MPERDCIRRTSRNGIQMKALLLEGNPYLHIVLCTADCLNGFHVVVALPPQLKDSGRKFDSRMKACLKYGSRSQTDSQFD